MLFFYFDSLILFYELKSVMSHIGCSRHEWVGVFITVKIIDVLNASIVNCEGTENSSHVCVRIF